jgi:hypothetical protein
VDGAIEILLGVLLLTALVVTAGWTVLVTPLYDLVQKYRVRSLLGRIRRNTCRCCRYNLRENTHRCPECGGPIASTPERVNALLQMTAARPLTNEFVVVNDADHDELQPEAPTDLGSRAAEASTGTTPSTGSPPSPG